MIKVTTEKFSIEADTVTDVREIMGILEEYSFSRYLVPAVSASIPFLKSYEEQVRNRLPKNRKLSTSLIKTAVVDLTDHYIKHPSINNVTAKRLANLAIMVICRRLGFNDTEIEEASEIKNVARKIWELRHKPNLRATKQYAELTTLLDGQGYLYN